MICSHTLYSKETRIKISEGVRRGWSLRLQKLMVQDGCFVEWRDMIADAARKGFAGGVSIQWSSYKILTEQMRQEGLENLQKKDRCRDQEVINEHQKHLSRGEKLHKPLQLSG
jgi:hypothetical protein